jgi:hypothetical protein
MDKLEGFLHRCAQIVESTLSVPCFVAFELGLSTATFGGNLHASLAGALIGLVIVDKSHTAGFTHTIFPVALLATITPFPITAGVTDGIVITHVERAWENEAGTCISISTLQVHCTIHANLP